MQSGRIYIGMMFSPVESVSTWPDAPFKCVHTRQRESRRACCFLDFKFVGRFISHCDDRRFVSTIRNLLRRLCMCSSLERVQLQTGNDINRRAFERDVAYKCIEAVTKWNYVNWANLEKFSLGYPGNAWISRKLRCCETLTNNNSDNINFRMFNLGTVTWNDSYISGDISAKIKQIRLSLRYTSNLLKLSTLVG